MKTLIRWTSNKHDFCDKEINSLQDILDLIKQEGDIIISQDCLLPGYDLEIEIYDDYRE